jgi:ribonucleoside-diphosphate reductase alpha chain
VILHRRGAGIGYDFSEVRPDGSKVHSTGREASGPISFMRLYDFSSEVIMNRGAVRHAGHMGILRIDHPDIEKFITAKKDYSQLTNFNISIAITDSFVNALAKQTFFSLMHDGKIYKKVDPNELLNLIVDSIYRSGEPGFVYIDEINRSNPTLHIGKMTATNQCGEQPLLPYEACNLGSVVLSKFVVENKLAANIKAVEKLNWKRLEHVIRVATRFLDNTVTVTHHLLPEIEAIVKYGNRKIGLGVMGWADLLYLLEIPYNSEEALKLAEKIMSFIQTIAHDESQKLGRERGDFGNFKGSLWQSKGYKHMRNATVTTIAPNGTTSLLADCNGGIEPFFALGYSRKNMETMGDTELIYANKYLEKKLKDEWLYDEQTMKEIISDGSLAKIKKIPDRIKKVFVTAFDISPEWHIRSQAAFQKYTDNAVSKTINFPESATKDDIKSAFLLASKLHLKGMTIYRDKSRDQQVLNLHKK